MHFWIFLNKNKSAVDIQRRILTANIFFFFKFFRNQMFHSFWWNLFLVYKSLNFLFSFFMFFFFPQLMTKFQILIIITIYNMFALVTGLQEENMTGIDLTVSPLFKANDF